MSRFDTLLLDQAKWDLVIDSAGNIARAAPPYALAQDVASAVRLFLGELWYATTKGIPYFEDVLGHLPPASLLTGYMEKAALTVPGVVSVQVIITEFTGREVRGEVQFIDELGVASGVAF
jgi:hypothetical protein